MTVDLRGTEILGYRVTELLGEGGMATVWRAEHTRLRKTVAIKVLDPLLARDGELVQRFFDEAQVQIDLKHPNIVAIENFSEDPLAMIMEFVEGRSLDEMIGREVGPIPIGTALPLMTQILDAVGHAHQSGVIHRDIKPANVLVTPDNAIKMMDFGIAKILGGSRMTQTGTSMGTAAYMSPEQIKGAKDVDARSDIYSLGVTFYEMLAGRTPFECETGTESDFELRMAQVQQAPPDPREFYPAIPETVVEVVQKALVKEPKERFASCEELKTALERAVKRDASPRPSPAKRVSPPHEPAESDSEKPSPQEPSPAPKPKPRAAKPTPAPKPRVKRPSSASPKRARTSSSAPSSSRVVKTAKDDEPATPVTKTLKVYTKALTLVPFAFLLALVVAVAVPARRCASSNRSNTSEGVQAPVARGVASPAPGEWVLIKAASFTMGSPASEPGRYDDEIQHRVTLTRDFLLQSTEVTQGQFEEVMGYDPSRYTGCGRSCPVERVNWHESAAYCNALSTREGLDACYSCSGSGREVRCEPSSRWSSPYVCPGYRLPTEAEWEHAARSGTTTALYTGAISILGQTNAPALDPIAWYGGNSGASYSGAYACSEWPEVQRRSTTCGPHPVGQKRANSWGLHDTLGNVWEWCHDWYGAYPNGAVTDPAGAASGSLRVYRGGSWSGNARNLRAANRDRSAPGDRFSYLGFRPARSR